MKDLPPQLENEAAAVTAEIADARPAFEMLAHVRGVAAAPARFDAFPGLAHVAASASAAQRARLLSMATGLHRRFVAAMEQPDTPARVAALRAELTKRGLAGFIVPLADEYQSEYLPLCSQRLAWICGFTGSAGLAIVLADAAAAWSDGRYTLQLRDQVDQGVFELCHTTESPPDGWLARNLKAGDRLGYDPWLHHLAPIAQWRQACEKAGAELVAVTDNPVDAVWRDRPPPPLGPVVAHDIRFAGAASADKRAAMARDISAAGAAAAVLTLPESVAWLLNVRGGDVPHTPLPLSMALLHGDGHVDWFVDDRKLAPDLGAHLGNGVAVRPPQDFAPALIDLGRDGKVVLADPATAAAAVFDILERAGAKIVRAPDPCLLPKACKNATELDGARAAHRRDGAALTRFLCWLADKAPKGGLDEMSAAAELMRLRRESELLQDLSFTTISAAGPNAALPHYRVSAKSNRKLENGQIYLVDSGGQYLDGTTDVTRTVMVGQPSAEMRDRFTRVLKGHIALATARFPQGTSGQQLDALARRALWDAGLDYDHGTGHGVGSYLSVHEGPQRIAKAGSPVPLKPGMIVSNEPGYYLTGAYGIRIENLVAVMALTPLPGAERPQLGFETLTLAPIDRVLIEPKLMTADEIAWLDAYHARVRREIAPLVDPATAKWLEKVTAPLGQ
jgi:Xaa-Pro aminopeptidase